jgi:hypothetical protein
VKISELTPHSRVLAASRAGVLTVAGLVRYPRKNLSTGEVAMRTMVAVQETSQKFFPKDLKPACICRLRSGRICEKAFDHREACEEGGDDGSGEEEVIAALQAFEPIVDGGRFAVELTQVDRERIVAMALEVRELREENAKLRAELEEAKRNLSPSTPFRPPLP